MLDKLLKSFELNDSSNLDKESNLLLNKDKNNNKLDDFWRVKNIININNKYYNELLNKENKEKKITYEGTYDSMVDISSGRVKIRGSKRELASLYIHDLADNKKILEIKKDNLGFINLYKTFNLKINDFKYSSSDNITKNLFINSIKLQRNNYLVPQNESDIFDLTKNYNKNRQISLEYLNKKISLILNKKNSFSDNLNIKNKFNKLDISFELNALKVETNLDKNSFSDFYNLNKKLNNNNNNNKSLDFIISHNKKTKVIGKRNITNLSYLFFKYPRLKNPNNLNDFGKNKYNTNIYLELNNVIKKKDIIPSILDKNRYKSLKKFSILNKVNGKIVLSSPKKVNLYKKYNFSDFNTKKELKINLNKYFTFNKKLLILNNFNFQEIFIKNIKKNNSSIINSYYRKTNNIKLLTKYNISEFINSKNNRLKFLIQIKRDFKLKLYSNINYNSGFNILDLKLLKDNNTLKPKEKITLKLIKNYTLSEINNKKLYNSLDVEKLSKIAEERKYINNVLSGLISNDNEVFKSLVTLDKRLEFYVNSVKNYLLEYKNLFQYAYKKSLARFNYSKIKLIGVTASGIIMILGISGISAKTYLKYSIKNNYNNLINLEFSDLETTGNILNKITKNIESDYELFQSISFFGDNIFYKNERITEANNILEGGVYLTQAGNLLLKEANKINTSFNKLNKSSIDNETYLNKYKNINLITDILQKDKKKILNILRLLKQAEKSYNNISLNNITLAKNNTELENGLLKLKKVKNILNKINSKSDYINSNYDSLLEILGDKRPINYLVLNQNRDEIRASGGFIGSTINFELYKGVIKKLKNKDVYFHDFNLINQEVPPEGLDLISPNHGLRDANYSPVFLENARKINYFYEKSGESSLDIVIGINQGITRQILELTGPIKLNINPKLELVINKDNFSEVMSVLVETKTGKNNSPKDILFTFIDKIKTKISENKKYKNLGEILINNIINGEVLIASNNIKFQKVIDNLQIFDKWKFDKGNIIYPVFTSISGNKSDRYLTRNFTIDSKEIKECIFQNTITLNTSHNMGESDKNRIKLLLNNLGIKKSNKIFEYLKIQGNGPNNSFIRIIVPRNSKILSNNLDKNSSHKNIRDIKLVKKNNYSEIIFYQKVLPSKSNLITISYLTSPVNCSPEIKFYKQPGLQNITVN